MNFLKVGYTSYWDKILSTNLPGSEMATNESEINLVLRVLGEVYGSDKNFGEVRGCEFRNNYKY